MPKESFVFFIKTYAGGMGSISGIHFFDNKNDNLDQIGVNPEDEVIIFILLLCTLEGGMGNKYFL